MHGARFQYRYPEIVQDIGRDMYRARQQLRRRGRYAAATSSAAEGDTATSTRTPEDNTATSGIDFSGIARIDGESKGINAMRTFLPTAGHDDLHRDHL
jgi:hypothetical protein